VHDAAGYLDDNFHLKKAVFTLLRDDESFAKQKHVTLAPHADDTEDVLVNKQ